MDRSLQKINRDAGDEKDKNLVYARFYSLQNNLPAARAAYHEAIDLFERMGMPRQLARVRAGLKALDKGPNGLPDAELPHLP